MNRILITALLLLGFGCNNSKKVDACLNGFEIISVNELGNGQIDYEIIGTLRAPSKGAYDFELAMEETLGVPRRTINGCLLFEENADEHFGYFVYDQRSNLNLDDIEHYQKVRAVLRRIKLKNPIAVSLRNQKNVEALYVIQDVKVLME